MCAVVQNPIIGRARNKFAGAIFSTWKGLNVLRSSPLTVANPDTEGQQIQRNKLKLMVKLYRSISGAVTVGFRQQAIQKSEYNAFASAMLLNSMLAPNSGDVSVVPEDLLVAKGTMTPTPIDSVADDGTDMTITWDAAAPLGVGQASTDLAYVVTFSNDQLDTLEFFGSSLGVVERSVGTLTFPLPDGASILPEHTYLFFASQNDNEVSDSVYSGSI